MQTQSIANSLQLIDQLKLRSSQSQAVYRTLLANGVMSLQYFRYSCYLVLLKVKVPDENQMDIATFFGMCLLML